MPPPLCCESSDIICSSCDNPYSINIWGRTHPNNTDGSCGAQIKWVKDQGKSASESCSFVANQPTTDFCRGCLPPAPPLCCEGEGFVCNACTDDAYNQWNNVATYGTCGAQIAWLHEEHDATRNYACTFVGEQSTTSSACSGCIPRNQPSDPPYPPQVPSPPRSPPLSPFYPSQSQLDTYNFCVLSLSQETLTINTQGPDRDIGDWASSLGELSQECTAAPSPPDIPPLPSSPSPLLSDRRLNDISSAASPPAFVFNYRKTDGTARQAGYYYAEKDEMPRLTVTTLLTEQIQCIRYIENVRGIGAGALGLQHYQQCHWYGFQSCPDSYTSDSVADYAPANVCNNAVMPGTVSNISVEPVYTVTDGIIRRLKYWFDPVSLHATLKPLEKRHLIDDGLGQRMYAPRACIRGHAVGWVRNHTRAAWCPDDRFCPRVNLASETRAVMSVHAIYEYYNQLEVCINYRIFETHACSISWNTILFTNPNLNAEEALIMESSSLVRVQM